MCARRNYICVAPNICCVCIEMAMESIQKIRRNGGTKKKTLWVIYDLIFIPFFLCLILIAFNDIPNAFDIIADAVADVRPYVSLMSAIVFRGANKRLRLNAEFHCSKNTRMLEYQIDQIIKRAVCTLSIYSHSYIQQFNRTTTTRTEQKNNNIHVVYMQQLISEIKKGKCQPKSRKIN